MEQHEAPTFDAMRAENAGRISHLLKVIEAGDTRATEATELLIRQAIERFAQGISKTDGSWTVMNLVKDAEVPRPTLYRYKREVELFQSMAACAPNSGVREELKRLRAELKDARQEGIAERKRHREAEAVLVERLHALSLIVAAAAGDSCLPSILKPK